MAEQLDLDYPELTLAPNSGLTWTLWGGVFLDDG